MVAAKRSAVAPINGALLQLQYYELAAPVIRACLNSCGLSGNQVGELIVGNALGAGGNPARLCALAAGLPEGVAGLSIDRQCCSGLDALVLADALIRSGQFDVVLAGGAESYSRRPARAHRFADGSLPRPYDQAQFTPWPDRNPDMHAAANALAIKLHIDRATQDRCAIRSHTLALNARAKMDAEIVAINGVALDTFTRELSVGVCNRAMPIVGDITPANTSVAADGAAFCVVVADHVAKQLDVPCIEIVAGCTLGGQPDLPGLAPVAAIRKVLGDAGVAVDKITVAEIMEAYAAQAIACIDGSGIDPECVNLGGGSLARGHPIGASGAINAVRLYHELARCRGHGLAAIAAAGGIGTALLMRA